MNRLKEYEFNLKYKTIMDRIVFIGRPSKFRFFFS